MKIINLKTVYICPDHNDKYHDRKIHMDTLLNKIGFKDIIHFKSSSEKYPTCLCKAIIDILKDNLDNPVLILEDDIEWTGLIDIEFEPHVDAIYLGLSKSGGHPTNNIHLGDSIFQPWSETQVKVINMLSGHAILYNSRKYKEAVIDILSNNLNELYHSDVLYSRLQPKYNILANKKPIFYQSSKFNKTMHEENWTKFELNI
jgi:hypothetical protein